MKKILSALVLTASLGLVACGQPPLKFNDGSHAPRPAVVMSEDGFKVLASFPTSGSSSYGAMSPTIERWSNGVKVATCPRGYHFDVTTIDPVNSDQPGAMATCDPNPAPTQPAK